MLKLHLKWSTLLWLFYGNINLSTLLGIIGMLIIKGRPILAGCLLIVAALVGIFNMSLIAGILWIVVAIMLFVKKDPNQPKQNLNQQK